MTKLINAFRNFAAAPKSGRQHERKKYRIKANEKLHCFAVCMKIIQNICKVILNSR
jgi:hypothetical protein